MTAVAASKIAAVTARPAGTSLPAGHHLTVATGDSANGMRAECACGWMSPHGQSADCLERDFADHLRDVADGLEGPGCVVCGRLELPWSVFCPSCLGALPITDLCRCRTNDQSAACLWAAIQTSRGTR